MSFVLLGILNSQAAGGAAGFPIPGVEPKLWLDASDASTISESGGSVSQWDNKGTLENMTQAISASQPTTGVSTLNGLNVIDFADDFLTGSTKSQWSFLHDGTTYFIALVAKFGNVANPDDIFGILGTKGGQSASIGLSLAYDDRSIFSRDDFLFLRGGPSNDTSILIFDNDFLDANNPLIFSSLIDPANVTAADRVEYFRNSTQGTLNNSETGGTTSADPTYNFHVGDTGRGDATLTGFIAELIIVSGADATETNRQTVVNYLNEKWSIF